MRVRAVGRVPRPMIPAHPPAGPDPSAALLDHRPVTLAKGESIVPFYQGESLQPGNQISGPAVVLRSDTAILLGPPDRASVDSFQNLIIDVGPP